MVTWLVNVHSVKIWIILYRYRPPTLQYNKILPEEMLWDLKSFIRELNDCSSRTTNSYSKTGCLSQTPGHSYEVRAKSSQCPLCGPQFWGIHYCPLLPLAADNLLWRPSCIRWIPALLFCPTKLLVQGSFFSYTPKKTKVFWPQYFCFQYIKSMYLSVFPSPFILSVFPGRWRPINTLLCFWGTC